MNEQKAPNGIEWTRVWGRRGFTWNPVAGCFHDCKWEMPDGKIAQCYAKTIAERMAQNAYPHGFEHHYWKPHLLEEPLKLKEPAGIFLDSMSDLMGREVDAAHIQAVLDVCRQADQHIFFLLTKNAPRLRQFTFPANVWVGVSSPPDYYRGKALSYHQRVAMLETSLKVLQSVDAPVRWMSFEPLSWDVSDVLWSYYDAFNWAVIGAASNGRQEFPPDEWDFENLMGFLTARVIPVFFKGNLRSLQVADQNWREEFPPQPQTVALVQERLL